MRYEGSPQTFARGSRVLEYWLAHGEGFWIRRGRLRAERVETVRVDPWSGRATTLVLRSLLRRRRSLPAEAVAAVDPFERVLVVSSRYAPSRAWIASAAVAGAARRLRPHVAILVAAARALAARGARGAAVRSCAAAAWLRPRLADGSRAAAAAILAATAATREAAARGGRELPPGVRRRHGRTRIRRVTGR